MIGSRRRFGGECWLAVFVLLLVGCRQASVEQPNLTPVSISSRTIDRQDLLCSGAFALHELDHVTAVPGGDLVQMFEANGGGVAINDLDNDGDLDIVLANHAAPNTILWNEGGLTFRTERMAHGDSRAVNIIDLDGDGWLDILFTRRVSAPNYWRNNQDGSFSLTLLPGVDKPLYAIDWGDLDGDGDLDFVGGTYDAALLAEFGQEFLASGDAGIYLYAQDGSGNFTATQLADQAQALALTLHDLNQDDKLDILVGNDFGVPDYVWVQSESGWEAADIFAATTHSTMSFDFGDIDNNGMFDLFATDMKPYAKDPITLAAWQPIIDSMMSDPHPEDDPQIMENVLQIGDQDSFYVNEAPRLGVNATGWSWSGKFGDLDQDGWLDLYVVNGFIEASTFVHQRNYELVEQNQAFHNDGQGGFAPMPAWELGSERSGRGMSMADLDLDGDLDIVVNNLRGAAQLFENQICEGGSIQIELNWENAGNRRGIGSQLRLHTDAGVMVRAVKAGSGYLSGDPSRIHFGFPEDARLERLEIIWADGKRSIVSDLQENNVLMVVRN